MVSNFNFRADAVIRRDGVVPIPRRFDGVAAQNYRGQRS